MTMDDSDLSFASILLGFRQTGDPSLVDLGNAKKMMVSCKPFDSNHNSPSMLLDTLSNHLLIEYCDIRRREIRSVMPATVFMKIVLPFLTRPQTIGLKLIMSLQLGAETLSFTETK